MPVICPPVTPLSPLEYEQQMAKINGLAPRIQIDLMDKDFAKSKSTVTLDDVWWPHGVLADVHLMYQEPFNELERLLHLKPHMVIIHVETMIHHMHFAAELHKEGIKAGLALLPETPVSNVEQILHSFDHMLIFSGDLGYFGGTADLSLLEKAHQAKEHHPELEVGWDGGVKPEVVQALVGGGVDVLNAGGFIQRSEHPHEAYRNLVKCLDEPSE